MRRPFQHWTRFCEFKPRQVARYKCFAEGKTLAGLHIAAIEAPNMNRGLSLEVLFNIAAVLEIEPYLLLKFNPDR